MNYFDANTWIGRWPFSFCDAPDAPALAQHLRKHGIRRALVSPFDAVFSPEPSPANRELLRVTRGITGLEPVPVINPVLGNVAEQVAEIVADRRVRAVKLLPNYHNYRLGSRAVEELLKQLQPARLRLIVQMQLIDHRHEYHAMTLKPVPAKDLAALLQRHPRQGVLASGLMRPDIVKLLPVFPRLLTDLSFAEWHDTIEHLLAKVSARQLAFASHTPLLITGAARAKVESAKLRTNQREAISAGNLVRFLEH